MKRLLFLTFTFYLLTLSAQPSDYVWTSPSQNSSESMPCGGGDVGMNVWVEHGDVLFYLSRSGCFDENNSLLKLGRFRISLSPGLDMQSFRQVLHLNEGYVEVTDGHISVQLWADVNKPVVHVTTSSKQGRLTVGATYESWRTNDITLSKRERFQTSYKFAAPKGLLTRHDSIIADPHAVTFFHHNGDTTIFDATVSQQRMDPVKDRLYNPLRRLTFGGQMSGRGFVLVDQVSGHYASSDFHGWLYVTEKPVRQAHLQITMATIQGTVADFQNTLAKTRQSVRLHADRQASRRWWRNFWQRSYITLVPCSSPLAPNSSLFTSQLHPLPLHVRL